MFVTAEKERELFIYYFLSLQFLSAVVPTILKLEAGWVRPGHESSVQPAYKSALSNVVSLLRAISSSPLHACLPATNAFPVQFAKFDQEKTRFHPVGWLYTMIAETHANIYLLDAYKPYASAATYSFAYTELARVVQRRNRKLIRYNG